MTHSPKDVLKEMSFRDLFDALSREKHNLSIPERDLNNMELIDMDRGGVSIGNRKVMWITIDGRKTLAIYQEGRDSLGPTRDFIFATHAEQIRLSFSLDKGKIPPIVMDTLTRTKDETLDRELLNGSGMRVYDKLPSFLASLARSEGRLVHELSRGETVHGISMPKEKWFSKFIPFIEKYKYTKVEGIDTWTQVYEP